MALVFSLISGAGWAFGQIITFKAFELVGSSRAMPITTAFQLLGASLWGVFALGNWPGITNKIIGFLALLVILIGARMTVWTETKQQEYSKNLRSAVIYALMNMSKGNAFKEKVSWQQIISGFFFAFAALTYLISAQPNMNGLATGFVLSQTSVVLATLTGIFFLNQKKTSKELMITIVGLVLILVAASITVFIK